MYSNYLFQPAQELSPEKGRFYSTLRFPEITEDTIEDIYVMTTYGDRLDLLASEYYGDSTLYKLIAIANAEYSFSSLFLEAGLQLRIPQGINFYELLEKTQQQI